MLNIYDCMEPVSIIGIATPMNTMCAGDVQPMNSDPLPIKKNKIKKKKKKMKSLKEYILEEVSEVNGFCILKPEFLDYSDDWFNMLQNNGWQIVQKKQMKMSHDLASKLYACHKDKDFYKDLCNYMSSDDCICCICHKNCDNPIKDMDILKDKVRKAWGKSDMKNAMHSSDSLNNVTRERKLIFE